jgi:hypothetical protein
MSISTQRESQQPEDVQKPSKPITRNAIPFGQLTSLLYLVTSLNFNDNLGSSFKNECNARALDPRFTALDAVAAILVQEHEVVAACYTSDLYKVSVISTEADVISYTDIVRVDIPSDTFPTLRLAALSNPDFKDELKNNRNPHKVHIQTGESHWKNVFASPRGWFYAFK